VDWTITDVGAAASGDVLGDLAGLLLDAVADGASVGFLVDLTRDGAEEWWRTALRDPRSTTWVACDPDGEVVGCVRLTAAAYPNGRHRAEVSKLLVRHDARGRGVAGALMQALEQHAWSDGRTVLVLDTRTGSLAESLYPRWGWERVGTAPDWAADPDGTLAPTTFFVKRLRPHS
jgi:GNAT superfamily N-acetyltransferase